MIIVIGRRTLFVKVVYDSAHVEDIDVHIAINITAGGGDDEGDVTQFSAWRRLVHGVADIENHMYRIAGFADIRVICPLHITFVWPVFPLIDD